MRGVVADRYPARLRQIPVILTMGDLLLFHGGSVRGFIQENQSDIDML